MTSDSRRERQLDETVRDSFPASDPPSHTGIVGPRSAGEAPRGSHAGERRADAAPRGSHAGARGTDAAPDPARHAPNAAHGRKDAAKPGRRG